MTLTLEISPEVERELTREAQARGLAMEAVALLAVADWTEKEKQRQRAERLAAVEHAHGLFAGHERTVDDFLADRHAEGEAEYDKYWERRLAREAQGKPDEVSP